MRMAKEVATLNNRLLALGEDGRLPGDLSESANNLSISIGKSVVRIGDADFIAKLNDELLCFSKVVAWHAGEHVVDGLELQATVNEI